MSLLSQQTNANTTETYFVRMNGKVLNVSTVNANTISTNTLEAESISTTLLSAYEGTFSTFSTAQIDIDGQLLTATPTELLLNGVPVATASSLSSIADWAIDPAISTVQLAGNNLLGASTISCITLVADQGIVASNLQVGNGIFNNLVAFNSLFVSSNTSTISSLAEFADLGVFSTISTGYLEAGTIAAQNISTPSLFVSSINGAEFTSTQITVEVGSFSSLVANSVSSVGAAIREALISTIVFSPSLNPSLGGVNVNLGLGGILGNVIGWGAGVLGAATGVVALGTSAFALASGRQTNYIDSSRYELVNGVTQLQFSTLGVPFSTIYRLTDSTDPERTPGAEVFVSTVNPPGIAVRSVSDPINTLSSPSSTIQAFGQWVPVPDELVNVSSFQEATISSLVVSSLGGAENIVNVGISTFLNGGATVPDGAGAVLEQFQQVNTYNVATDQLQSYFSSVIEVSNDMTFTSGTGISTSFLNDSGRAFVSSLSTATIEAADANLFGLGIQGLTIQTAAGGQLFISTSQTNIQGLINASSLGAFNVAARNGGISTLGVSSLAASTIGANIAAISTATVSSLAFAQAGAYGLSSLMWLSTAFNPTQGTSTTVYMNTDLTLGQNDLYAQQVRLGRYTADSSTVPELIMYGDDGSNRGFSAATADKTVRVYNNAIPLTSTGYILDTYINPPLFSTIANSTCLVAWFPSTTKSTIGYSTISIIPPINSFGAFYSSTSQTVAGSNTVTPLTYNSQALNVGGFSFAGSTITVAIPGTYAITHSVQFATTSGGTNQAQFWLLKNGAAVAQTNSIVSIVNNGDTIGTIELFDTAAANDKYGIAIYSADANMTAKAVAAGATPAIPSIITNIKRLG